MTDWIEDGEAGSSVRTKLNSLTHQVSTGLVSSPVLYINIPIPGIGNNFELKIDGFLFDTSDYLMGAVSFDNGATWPFDNETFLAYTDVNLTAYGASTKTDRAISNPLAAGADTLLSFISSNISDGSTFSGIPPIGASGTIHIDPGSASKCASFRSELIFDLGDTDPDYYLALNKSVARVLSTLGRITNLAILPYGAGDMPPSGTETITAGSYVLSEVK